MIGYYVHHQGAGHLHRMRSITSHLDEPVTVLSSLPRPDRFAGEWVCLVRDDNQPEPRDVTAGGTLHWAPRRDPDLARRTAQIVEWLHQAQPRLVVVDVSVEVALLVRLAGVPVIVAGMPGDRSDRPHTTAYDLADTLLAPWPADAPTDWPQRWLDKTEHVGAISRFDGLARPVGRRGDGPLGLLLGGHGGSGPTPAQLDELRAGTPGWTWRIAQSGQRLGPDELWHALGTSDVVVTHAGQNAVAEVAAARAPAVVVAAERPFGEQQHTAHRLRSLGIAVGLDTWPDADRWPGLLRQAVRLGGQEWSRWSYGDGARRAARVLEA